MTRIRELIAQIRSRYPKDDFFENFESSCKIAKGKKAQYQCYNGALLTLDAESWKLLKEKALQHYLNHREGQRKQGFFNQLNEAFAYRYLIRMGYSDIRFIPEGKERRPDIGYTRSGVQMYCEVKTLGISKDEITRRNGGMAYDGAVYARLDEGFIKKFCDAVCTAKAQINALGSEGLVYVVVRLDDIALDCYRTYRTQLIRVSATNGFDNLFIKIGLLGNKRICIPRCSTGWLMAMR